MRERTPHLTDEQIVALTVLLEVECNVCADGCSGKWCKARERIKAAFGIELA